MSKVIHGELCKKLKFDLKNKWYTHNPASVLENDTHKLFWDFKIETDHLISARWPDLIIIINKKRVMDFAMPADHRVKLKESEKKDKYLDLTRELKKLWNLNVTVIPIVICALGSHQRIDTGAGGLGNKSTSGDHPYYRFIKIGQKTKKRPGDLRRLGVTQNPVRNHRLIPTSESRELVQKECKARYDWVRWSSGNCSRNSDLTILPDGICITQNASWEMRRSNLSRILRYKQIN